MPDIRKINTLIRLLKAERVAFEMRDFHSGMDFPQERNLCDSAMCLAGLTNYYIHSKAFRVKSPIVTYGQLANTDTARHWLGLTSEQADQLFLMKFNGRDSNPIVELFEFDMKLPKDIRIAIAIRVLEDLRDTKRVTWKEVLTEFGILDEAYTLPQWQNAKIPNHA